MKCKGIRDWSANIRAYYIHTPSAAPTTSLHRFDVLAHKMGRTRAHTKERQYARRGLLRSNPSLRGLPRSVSSHWLKKASRGSYTAVLAPVVPLRLLHHYSTTSSTSMARRLPAPHGTPDSADGDSTHDAQPRNPSRENSAATSSRGGAENTIKRRAHRKSRFGCKNCKTRRIKCDERKPECTNCRHRQVRCDYLPVAAPNPSQSLGGEPAGSPVGSTPQNSGLNIADIELMYHWATSTTYSLSVQNSGAMHWRTDITELGLKNHHTLHLVFAITALHLAYCRPTRRDEYLRQADHHYSAALPDVTAELAHLNQDNCDAVLISVQIICFITWARGPQPGEYLAFGENGRSEWLVMFRGIRTTIESLGYESFVKSHAPSIRAKAKPLPPNPAAPAYKEPLADLRDYIQYGSSPSLLETNRYAFDKLLECYNNRYGGVDGEYHVVFAWLYKMQDDFLEALQQHDSVALVIYAHFAVLMNDLECFWYMKGWTAHVLSGIWSILRDEDRVHARWAISVVGWIPP